MLYTNLKHIESAAEYAGIVNENENVMIICGRMGPFSIPVYRIAEELERNYAHVKFYDMEYDNPESAVIRNLREVQDFCGISVNHLLQKRRSCKCYSRHSNQRTGNSHFRT